MSVLWTNCPFFRSWMSVSCTTGPFLMLIPLLGSAFYFPLPCYSSLSYQLRKGFTKLTGPDHPLQLNILTFYYHPIFPFVFVWFCGWYLCSPLGGNSNGFVCFLFIAVVSSAWHIICSEWINEWVDKTTWHKNGWWCIWELVWFQLGSTAAGELQPKSGPCLPEKVICLLDWASRVLHVELSGRKRLLALASRCLWLALSTKNAIFDLLNCYWRPSNLLLIGWESFYYKIHPFG